MKNSKVKATLIVICLFLLSQVSIFAAASTDRSILDVESVSQKRGRSVYKSRTTRSIRKKRAHSSGRGSYSTSGRSNYIRGPRGGCYYLNKNGNKTYVSRNLCN